MANAFELLSNNNGLITGSLTPPGALSFKSPQHSLGTLEISLSQNLTVNEQLNAANSLGATVYMVTSSLNTNTIESFCLSNTQGITSSAKIDNHDYENITSSDYPNVLQGSNSVSWNMFPQPEIVIPEELVELPRRDLSRFKKAYSFSRPRPKRIRIYRSR